MTTVISVENLGKKYTLHHQQRESYTALRDVLANGATSIGQKILHPFRKPPTDQQTQEDFWALKDVSFEVKQGDRIGIIGRNGAGKSTLLKILSRITEPTTGRVKIKGRVASLLEVGTGFHPELTGRENIYLNGAILGMSRVEIKKKFDEIVDFTEIEKFLDTPVKRYSSGMYVRLAFAVAAHLEPEILVVDEVLAVGDAQFQKKCLGKMENISTKEGRTVLFVSHNLSTIRNICNRSILLCTGSVAIDGSCESAITMYSKTISQNSNWTRPHPAQNSNKLFFTSVAIRKPEITASNVSRGYASFEICLEYLVAVPLVGVQVAIRVVNQEGVAVFTTANTDSLGTLVDIAQGVHRDMISIPADFLPPGKYSLLVAAMKPNIEIYDKVENQVSFLIEDIVNHATILNDGRLGVVTPLLHWKKYELESYP